MYGSLQGLALLALGANAGPLLSACSLGRGPLAAAPITARQESQNLATPASIAPVPTGSAAPRSSLDAGVVATGIVDPAIVAAAVKVSAEDTAAPTPATACSLVTWDEALLTETHVGYTLDTTTKMESFTTYTIPGGPGCECDRGLIAGLYHTHGRDGQETYYCATGGDYLTAPPMSTAVATGTPGDPDNAAWAEITCDYGSLGSFDNNPWQQWNDSGAAAAWAVAQEEWERVDRNESETLYNFLGNFFNARPDLGCENLQNSNCDVTINCGQGISEPNAPVSSPAGYVIIDSMIWWHRVLQRMYNGINDGLPQVLADVGLFVETLSPITDEIEEQQAEKLGWTVYSLV